MLPPTSPPHQTGNGTADQQGDATGLRNTCHAETEVVVLVRRVAAAAAGGQQVVGVVVPTAAPQNPRRTVQNRLIPLPKVAALVERPVGAGRVLEIANHGRVVRAADRMTVLVEVRVVPRAWGEHTTQTPEKQGVDDQSGAKSGALVNDAAVALPLADQRNSLSALAAALLTLSDADRERLAAVMALLSRNGEE